MRLILALLVVLTVPASAQQRRAMTPDDIMTMKNVSDAQISPDGKWVAYVVTSTDMKENANDADVWLVSTAGGEPARLTTNKKSDSQPRWSPDGKKIAFVSAREDKPQIFLISPFGGEAEKFTDSKSGVQSFQWSPDGSRIAYVAQQEPTAEEEKKLKDKDDAQVIDQNFKLARIWVINVTTKKATDVVKGDYTASDPQWSPDGRQIAFVSDRSGSPQLYIMNRDGGNLQRLTFTGSYNAAPTWSPDGRWIAYETRVRGQFDIWLIDPSGQINFPVIQHPKSDEGPTWAADGRKLAFSSSRRGRYDIYVADWNGENVLRVTESSGSNIQPAWGPQPR